MWSFTWRILWSGFNIYLQLVKSVFLRNYLTFDTQTEHWFNLDVKQNGMTENVPDFWRSSVFKRDFKWTIEQQGKLCQMKENFLLVSWVYCSNGSSSGAGNGRT